jgi:hypothetical protein
MTAESTLERLKALEKAATRGPWTAWQRRHKNDWCIDSDEALLSRLAELRGPESSANTCVSADAALICALRNAAPGLLAVVEAAKMLMDSGGLSLESEGARDAHGLLFDALRALEEGK